MACEVNVQFDVNVGLTFRESLNEEQIEQVQNVIRDEIASLFTKRNDVEMQWVVSSLRGIYAESVATMVTPADTVVDIVSDEEAFGSQ